MQSSASNSKLRYIVEASKPRYASPYKPPHSTAPLVTVPTYLVLADDLEGKSLDDSSVPPMDAPTLKEDEVQINQSLNKQNPIRNPGNTKNCLPFLVLKNHKSL